LQEEEKEQQVAKRKTTTPVVGKNRSGVFGSTTPDILTSVAGAVGYLFHLVRGSERHV